MSVVELPSQGRDIPFRMFHSFCILARFKIYNFFGRDVFGKFYARDLACWEFASGAYQRKDTPRFELDTRVIF